MMRLSNLPLQRVKEIVDHVVDGLEARGINRAVARHIVKARAISTIYALGNVVIGPRMYKYLARGLVHMQRRNFDNALLNEYERKLDRLLLKLIAEVDERDYESLLAKVQGTYHEEK